MGRLAGDGGPALRRIAAVAALLAGCGGDVEPSRPEAEAPRLPAPSEDVGKARPVATVAAPAASSPTPAPRNPRRAPPDLDRLVTEWNAAGDSPERQRAAVDAIVAAGPAVLDRLVAWLDSEDAARSKCALALLQQAGAPAVERLIARIEAGPRSRSNSEAWLLVRLRGWWAYDEVLGPRVCRAALRSSDRSLDRVCDLLGAARPAVSGFATEIASYWLPTSSPKIDYTTHATHLLFKIRADSAPAAPAIVASLATLASRQPWPAGEYLFHQNEAAHELVEALEFVGARSPEILPTLRRLLADAPDALRRDLASRVLAHWGDLGADAAPELRAMLATGDAKTRAAAADALVAMPSLSPDLGREILETLAKSGADPRLAEEALRALVCDADHARRLGEAIPALPASAMPVAWDVVSRSGSFDLAGLSPALVHHTLPAGRLLALRAWSAPSTKTPGADALALLDDASAQVRAAAAATFAAIGAIPDERAMRIVTPLASDANVVVRCEAARSLAAMCDRNTAARGLVAALLDDADPAVRDAALRGLAHGTSSVPGTHQAAISGAVARLAVWTRWGGDAWKDDVRGLLRVDGGAEALGAIVLAALTAQDDRSDRAQLAAGIAALAGPRLASIRPDLERAMAAPRLPRAAQEILATLCEITVDADAIARSAPAGRETVERLLALGAPGRRALPLFAERNSASAPACLEAIRGVAVDQVVLDALRGLPDDRFGLDRRRGAIRLTSLLPPARAVEGLLPLLVDADEATSRAAALALVETELRAPGSVPVELVPTLLRVRAADGLKLAVALGPRVVDLVPELRARRDGPSVPESALAAAALWRVTGRADDAMPTLRELLSHPERTEGVDWSTVGSVLREVPLAEIEFAGVLRTAQVHEWYAGGPLAPVLSRFGQDAAPAVPMLRVMLQSGNDVAAARALGEIGAAARDAIPDLWWRACGWSGHREPGDLGASAAREAIRRIEAAPK